MFAMCIAFQFKGQTFKPARPIRVVADGRPKDHVWAGCARGEILEWWKKRGALLADLHAEKFAERSSRDGRIVWGEVPAGTVLRALIDPSKGPGKELIKVVTRAATPEEAAHFGHDRLPLIESPLYPGVIPEAGPEPPVQLQGRLFPD
ncbi:MAG: hypothetical protein SFU85_00200 [Candidatus Methylacidiphilales bacterium]|nr:hypothetical protein [Candidatus Methylacidiphilales bacterium]